jgi:hypothetical protein
LVKPEPKRGSRAQARNVIPVAGRGSCILFDTIFRVRLSLGGVFHSRRNFSIWGGETMSVSVGLAIGTVVVIMVIFAVFGLAAAKAEKIVSAKAKEAREGQTRNVAKATVVKTKKK